MTLFYESAKSLVQHILRKAKQIHDKDYQVDPLGFIDAISQIFPCRSDHRFLYDFKRSVFSQSLNYFLVLKKNILIPESITLSVFSREEIVLVLGASPFLVLIYEAFFEAATGFHHSNVRIPLKWERRIARFMATPRMHGIHHSIVKRETDSNFSVIFNFWDRIHRTIRLNISQDEIDRKNDHRPYSAALFRNSSKG